MAGLDDLSRGELADILRRLRILETASPLQNASIGESGLRVYNGGVITIENGGLNVTGTATITGTLQADGTIALTGTLTQSGPSTFTGATGITGPLTVTGATHLNGTTDVAGNTTVTGDFTTVGPMKTTGTLSVEGVTMLKNDLNVTTGKIVAGGVTVDPSYLSGSVKFSNGSYVAATPNGAQMVKGSTGGAVTVSDAQADIGVAGGGSVIAKSTEARITFGTKAFIQNSTGTYFSGLPTTTSPGNLYVSPTTGQVFRSTA